MKAWVKGMRSVAAGIVAACVTAMIGAQAFAAENLGRPTDKAIGLQPAASELKYDAIWFHDIVLMPVITIISLFVLVLLLIVIFRFNKRANPVPAKWSHNTKIEIIWTLAPVLILMVIAVFSFRLLFKYHDMPTPDLTVKATGYQWYWGYEYPDQKIAEITSGMMPKEKVADKELYLLAATEPMVVPVNKVVRVQVTGADVIHAFALPAFGLKTDAVPGRLNETWFRADKIGTYYGQCSELCGVDHSAMPIEIKVVSQADFDAWVASKAAPPAPAAAAPAAAPAAGAAPAAATPAAAAPAAAAPAPAAAAPAGATH